MKKNSFFNVIFFTVSTVLLIFGGCDEPVQQKISLQLRPAEQEQATYKVLTESQRTLSYEGTFDNKESLKGGSNINKVEMTFTQQIQNVSKEGNITAKITIESLKVSSVTRDELTFSYDSSNEKDNKSPMARMIGQSYVIELSTQFQVIRVVDAASARKAAAGTDEAQRRAQLLLTDDEIKERHSVAGIGSKQVSAAEVGDTWSDIKDFSFPIMGTKSYERIYTLEEIKPQDSGRIAVIDMKALPSVSAGESSRASALMDMSDNIRTYQGKLEINIDAGLIQSYLEQFDSEWIFVDPEHKPDDPAPPAAFRLGAVRLYSLERIN